MHIALTEKPVDARTVEQAYYRASRAQKEQRLSFCETGQRLARMRHPDLLRTLERGAEVLDKMAEQQLGQTLRSSSSSTSERARPTEASLWREAYRFADKGEPLAQFGWIYGAAGWLAGLVYDT
jgi:hypothetical protein